MRWVGWQLDTLIYADGNSCMYDYNADGIRVEKVIKGKETHKYLLEGDRIIREEILDKNGARKHLLWYNYDGNGQLTSVEYDGNKYLYKVNQMGDVLGLYNTAGAQVVRYRYDAWGKLLEVKNNNGLAITDPENVGLRNPFRYRGYYYDADTGFYYLNARYYDPETGRFLNADGYASTGQGFVGSNMFAYCNNNPVMYADYTGDFWGIVAIIAGVAAAVAIGITVGVTVANSDPPSSQSYSTIEDATNAWKSENQSRDQSVEHGAIIYENTDKKTKEKTYTYGRTYSGGKSNNIRGFVVGYVSGGTTALVSSKKRMVGYIHSHPDPSSGYHNDFLSDVDLFLANLPGISNVYVVPNQRCEGIPEIISANDAIVWDTVEHMGEE